MKKPESDKSYILLKEKLARHEQILIQAFKSLKKKEEELKKLNEILRAGEEELKAQNDELQIANKKVFAINEELYKKNKIIEDQNSELEATLHHLKETQAQLLQAEKMASLGVLASGIAHEINNPLNFIQGAFSGLQTYFADHPPHSEEQVNTLLNCLKEGVERTSIIVQSLNHFSSNKAEINEQCDIHSIIENCLVILNSQLKNEIVIKKSFFKQSVSINGNMGKLHQAFLNVLVNACQAIDGLGEISIKTSMSNEYFEIEISDNGIGIIEQNIRKVTDPFFTTKAPGKGTGLGLSITYNLIKEHNGKLEIESDPGKGTSVRIFLPVD